MLRCISRSVLIRPSLNKHYICRENQLICCLRLSSRRHASKHSVASIFRSTLRRARVLGGYNVDPNTESVAAAHLDPDKVDALSSEEINHAIEELDAIQEGSRLQQTGQPETPTSRGRKAGNLIDATKSDSNKKRRKKSAASIANHLTVFTVNDLPFQLLDIPRSSVPELAHGLDRVLFNPGVYNLRDPRSKVYNFDPYLEKILPPQDFDFDALSGYQAASADSTLTSIAEKHEAKYFTSTSNVSGVLKHFHYLLSQWRPLTFSMMSKGFNAPGDDFTRICMAPEAIVLKKSGTRYAIDKDKEFDNGHILGLVGRSLEKLLTVPRETFEQYRLSNKDRTSPKDDGQGYHYSMSDQILVRAQLDAYDPRVPRTGIFDIKTRAVLSIRMDKGPQRDVAKGYQLVSRLGNLESYEREYFDMIRATMLKYSLQVRLGHMDGIFCAYHNLDRMFGFQYISLEDMDLALHGQIDSTLGDQELKTSMKLLEEALDLITKRFPDQHVRIHFVTRKRRVPVMQIIAEPVTDEQIAAIEDASARRVQEFEKSILSPDKPTDEHARVELEQKAAWQEMTDDIEHGNEEGEDDEETPEMDDKDMARDEQVTKSAYENLEAIRQRIFDAAVAVEAVAVSALNIWANMAKGQFANHEKPLAKLQKRTQSVEKSIWNELEGLTALQWPEDLADVSAQLGEALGNLEKVVDMYKEKNVRLVARLGSQMGVAVTDADSVEFASEAKNETKKDEEVAEELKNSQRRVRDMMEDIVMLRRAIEKASSSQSPQLPSSADIRRPSKSEARVIGTTHSSGEQRSPQRKFLALTLAIRNKVNGAYVTRPENLKRSQEWQVEYAFSEVQGQERILDLHSGVLKQRAMLEQLEMDEEKLRLWYELPFIRDLMKASERGHARRKRQDKLDERQGGRVVFVSNEERQRSQVGERMAARAENGEES